MTSGRAVTLLLVEDDELDVMGVRRALAAQKIANPVVVARDGVEGFEFLRGENGRTKVEAPFIILLDLNMPRMNGVEFLEKIREDPELHTSIIFVLTTSDDDADVTRAYEQNIAGYIVKSDSGAGFSSAVKLIDYYWTIVELPGG